MDSKENQVEQMANDIWVSCPTQDMTYGETVFTAEALIAKGYRKASDIAREIFEEIDKLAKEGGVIWTNYARAVLAELKKKYTESEDTE